MTREEAIAILEVSKHMATSGRMYNQAIDMAIESLSAEHSKPLQTTLNGDLISRADAINTLETEKRCTDREEDVSGLTLAKLLIYALPSAGAVSHEEYEEVKAYMDTLVDAFIEDGEELAESVKVVRCKDCRHRYEEGDNTHYYWCRLNDRPIDDTDYCAWGERREP